MGIEGEVGLGCVCLGMRTNIQRKGNDGIKLEGREEKEREWWYSSSSWVCGHIGRQNTRGLVRWHNVTIIR